MANEAPDPRAFKTWEDAFQYPIPVVRKLEQQLRSNAGENREKLRSLVGASYRSLLDTAETIIDMEVRMEEVETTLAKVGRDCNSRALERIAGNAGRLEGGLRSRDLERYTFASQLAVLRNCPVVMARLMKSEGSYLLIAKVLVISRLLHNSLSQSKHKPPIVDQLSERLFSVREKLRRRINKRLASTTGETSSLVEALSAYALATSSTPTVVLDHFLRVRLGKISSSLKEGGDELAKHGISALKLCIQTCTDTQTIFPRRLADSLAKLKVHPLIQDPDVRNLYELNLDVHDRWIGDEARNYTPYPRYDELQRAEAERILQRWGRDAIAAFLKGIKSALEEEGRLKEVASLRQEVIETWILSGARMAGVKSANILDDLRDTMNEKLEGIVRARTQGLKGVVDDLVDRLETYSPKYEEGLSLWNATSKTNDLGNGAVTFKSTISNTHQGRDDAVINIVEKFDKWMDSVLEVKSIVKSMKEARWDDTFAEDVDDDSDDDLGESKQTLLSDDDPRLLEDVTLEALADTLKNLGKAFEKIVREVSKDGDGDAVPQAVFILRVVREVGDRVPRLRLHDRAIPLSSPFTPSLLKPLHTVLAQQVVQPIIQAYQKWLAASTTARSKSHILWEGNPPLPAQPSPSAFRFLKDLEKKMASYGADLWAPMVVQVLKSLVLEQVLESFKNELEAIKDMNVPSSNVMKNDSDPKEPEEAERADTEREKEAASKETGPDAQILKDQKIKQLTFDILYILRFIGASSDDNPIEDLMKTNAEGLDEPAMIRLKKNAQDYARKTYLLFAILA